MTCGLAVTVACSQAGLAPALEFLSVLVLMLLLETHLWGHVMTMSEATYRAPWCTRKPSGDAGAHLYPLGRAERTEVTFATALPRTTPRRKWGGARASSFLKRFSGKSM